MTMIYVASDIHGQYEKLVKLLEAINFNSTDELYILGDIIDRGPEIVKVVDLVMNTPNIHMILGNHEDMFLNYWRTKSIWDEGLRYKNGGGKTDAEFSQLPQSKVEEYVKFFESLPIELELTVNNKVYWLVHGNYVTEKERNYFNPLEYRSNIIWGRVKKEDMGPKDKIVIFGHTPTDKYLGKDNPFAIWKNGNVIGIDCGLAKISVYEDKCRLGCLCLDDMTEIYV